MNIRAISLAMSAALPVAPANAGETEEQHKASVTLSRHYTTNALDSPLALEDWYTLLRGSMENTIRHEFGATRIAADIETRHFETYEIENDMALGISADTTVTVSEMMELRGTLSAKIAEEGDELMLDDTFLGMRTRKTVLSADLQAGLRLSAETVLVLEGAISRETPGKTRFEHGLLPPFQLDPTRDRMRVGGKLTRTHGRFTYGVQGASGVMHSAPIEILPELRVLDYAAAAHASVALGNNAVLAASVGLHGLNLLESSFSEIRPAYEVAASTSLPAGFSLRGTLRAAYDPKSSDDPVATWVQRIEAEAGYELTPLMRLSTGAFAEQRSYIGLQSLEVARGLYAQAAWAASPRATLSLRIDATQKTIEEVRLERRTVDVSMAVNLKL